MKQNWIFWITENNLLLHSNYINIYSNYISIYIIYYDNMKINNLKFSLYSYNDTKRFIKYFYRYVKFNKIVFQKDLWI
jgi:hypothetical protein